MKTNELKTLRVKLIAIIGGASMCGPAIAAAYVGTADDLTQMQQLLAGYSNALDGWDPEGYAAVFTPNGRWHGSTRCYTGREQIMALGAGEAKRLSAPGEYAHSHMTVLGHVIFDDANHAHAHETNILIGSTGQVEPLKGGAGLLYTGYYNDVFERVNGRWLIADRDENSGKDPVTGIHDEKYHPPRPCPPDPPGTVASTSTSAVAAKPTGYVGTPDDFTQLQQLIAKYANALDAWDHEGYASVFAPNAHWNRCITGKDQFIALAKTESDKLSFPGTVPHSHMTVLGRVIFDDKNHAHSHQTNILVGSQGFVEPLKMGAGLYYTGYYNDVFERQPDGRWLILDRDETSGRDPVTGRVDEKYHPPLPCTRPPPYMPTVAPPR